MLLRSHERNAIVDVDDDTLSAIYSCENIRTGVSSEGSLKRARVRATRFFVAVLV